MTEQLNLFDDNVQIVEKNGITMFRCDLCFARWVTPGSLCPLCHPSQASAACYDCGSVFEDERYMIESMKISGHAECGLCLPRVTADDCRDQNELRREAEERWLDWEVHRQAASRLSFRAKTVATDE